MHRNFRKTLGSIALFSSLVFASSAAQADYFIRPYIQFGSAGIIDGYEANGATSGSQSFTSNLEANVDLADGTVRNYLSVDGTGTFASVSGIFGDTLHFAGGAGTDVTLSFAYDGTIQSDQAMADNLYAYVNVNFFVFDTSAGATYQDFTTHSGALLNKSSFTLFNPEVGESLDEFIANTLSGTFTLGGSGSYDIFAGLSIAVANNDNGGNVTMDFLHTAALSVATQPGVEYSSDSGVFPGSVAPLPAVPEPASWAMMIAGLGWAGGLMRRRAARQTVRWGMLPA